VLTAITVCLGGKASVTNRASNMKAFVKTGARLTILSFSFFFFLNLLLNNSVFFFFFFAFQFSACEITVKIKNRGPDGYRPKEYGDSISVERKITNDGVSSYRLKGLVWFFFLKELF